LSRKEETVTGGLRNKFSMLNDGGISDSSREHSEDRSSESRRDRIAGGPSRSMMVLPASREASIDAERQRALEAVRQTFKANAAVAGGSSASVGHLNRSRPVPENLAEAREDIEQAKQLKGKKDLTPDKIEQYARLLVDEYLHDGNETVSILLWQDNPKLICSHYICSFVS
jgi:DNA-binding helix-hairpin-helix protein with protein kinase domain